MQDNFTSGDITAERDIQARDIITGIQQNFTLIFEAPFAPPPDLETLRADYLAAFAEFVRRIKQGCRQHSIDYVQVGTSDSLEVALSTYLAARAARTR